MPKSAHTVVPIPFCLRISYLGVSHQPRESLRSRGLGEHHDDRKKTFAPRRNDIASVHHPRRGGAPVGRHKNKQPPKHGITGLQERSGCAFLCMAPWFDHGTPQTWSLWRRHRVGRGCSAVREGAGRARVCVLGSSHWVLPTSGITSHALARARCGARWCAAGRPYPCCNRRRRHLIAATLAQSPVRTRRRNPDAAGSLAILNDFQTLQEAVSCK